jgi:hypothetical protein
VVIWHRKDLFPFGEDEAADYFDGLSHCSALVGINTSAMIEAAIAGRPVHTIALPEWRAMQDDFLHFHYLFPEHGGFLRKAGSFGEHVELLGTDIREPSTAAARGHAFAETFLRPLGLSQPATPIFIAHLEAAAAAAPSVRRVSELGALPFRLLLAAAASRYRLRAVRDVPLRGLYGATSVWCAHHGVIGRIRLQRVALWLREREDRALERLEWLGASDTDRRLPAEKWVYRRLAAERRRTTPHGSQPRQRPKKWLAAIGRERRAAGLPHGTETGR